ncbi:MAG: nucleotidyltransferase substrate binding protein [Rhodocyclaceae bacterium]|nr:nucleotidyltransferase substrate binding protein [Rhodocyclaceae bacterium]
MRLNAALDIFLASVADYPGFDPDQNYTPKESEPLDALSDRFLRAFESSLRFFRTWEQVREAAPSESFRDLLLRMEKLGLISEISVWLALRDVRNRIAHEYLPDELAKIYAALVGSGATEFRRLREQAERLT